MREAPDTPSQDEIEDFYWRQARVDPDAAIDRLIDRFGYAAAHYILTHLAAGDPEED